ncbi:biotin carboxylase [Chimaeribacter arupi]|uniref:biotin carboxylase n=1 Tax=Chimaeribacter arupi TaxID=2060066 RepID=UPI000C7A41B0|nr:biotin carboxylase [Chimaeribacter arupi]PLR52344.1 biotin carboxylase [Chimaeribacter arupi]
MTTPCFIVTGYNNVRIYDVGKIRAEARKHFDAHVVLVTEKKQPIDEQAADQVIEVSFSPPAREAGAAAIRHQLEQAGLRPIGILPFSDRGVPMGAHLAAHYGLPGAAVQQAQAGLDKRLFRALDSRAASHPTGYRVVSSVQVNSAAALVREVDRLGGKAFIKPAQEGNSRGCRVISHREECDAIWAEMTPYHGGGIMVESLIEAASEFSWDYVAGRQWITEKRTTEGLYRAEYQQIVPACLPEGDQAMIEAAGDHMRRLVSVENGVWHNEIFLLPGATAAVETNMRPAGMHIWDLARISYEAFNPWLLWLRWATDGNMAQAVLQQRAFSGIRMLRARRAGRLTQLPDIHALAGERGIPLHEGHFSVLPGDTLSDAIQSNADFIGFIILSHPDYARLTHDLDALAAAIEAAVEIA